MTNPIERTITFGPHVSGHRDHNNVNFKIEPPIEIIEPVSFSRAVSNHPENEVNRELLVDRLAFTFNDESATHGILSVTANQRVIDERFERVMEESFSSIFLLSNAALKFVFTETER